MMHKKLALAVAIAAVPVAGFSVEAMDDEMLAGVTGQDGISLSLGLNVTTDVLVEDDNGVTGSAVYGNVVNDNAGGILITGAGLNTGAGTLDVDIDAGGDAGNTDAQLQVSVSIPANTVLITGAIGVVNTDGAFATQSAVQNILTSTTITLTSGLTMDIELGAEETAFIDLSSANIGTITMGAGSLVDASSTASISWAGQTISGIDATGTTINVEATGLEIDLTGSALSNITIEITDLQFGTAPVLGDIQISGLDLTGSTITVAGKN